MSGETEAAHQPQVAIPAGLPADTIEWLRKLDHAAKEFFKVACHQKTNSSYKRKLGVDLQWLCNLAVAQVTKKTEDIAL